MQQNRGKKRAHSAPPIDHYRRHGLGLAVLLGLGLGFAAPVQARRYEGYEFAESLQLGGSVLRLNGVGMRAVSVIKGYLAALYLGKPATTPAAVYATPGPKRIQMRMLLEASTEEFVKAINKGVARNCSEAERAALATKLPPFIATIRALGKVRPKDLVDMDYLPERGTLLQFNGKPAGEAVPGPELYQALLKVFLGERPVDKRLKAGLLGAPAE
jgi:Chalcone isomerase-like